MSDGSRLTARDLRDIAEIRRLLIEVIRSSDVLFEMGLEEITGPEFDEFWCSLHQFNVWAESRVVAIDRILSEHLTLHVVKKA